MTAVKCHIAKGLKLSFALIVSVMQLCFKLNRNTGHLSENVFLLSYFSTCNLNQVKKCNIKDSLCIRLQAGTNMQVTGEAES